MSELKEVVETAKTRRSVDGKRNMAARARRSLVDSELRQMYDAVLAEPVPQALVDCLGHIHDRGGGKDDVTS